MLEVKKNVYDNVIKELEKEEIKRRKIDFKAYSMLVLSLLLLIFMVCFIDINKLFGSGIKVTVGHVLFTITIIGLYTAVITISLINIIRYFVILKDKYKDDKDYAEYIFKLNNNKDTEEVLDILIKDNVGIINEKKKINLKKIKSLNSSYVLFIINVFLSITLEIFTKFIIR